MNALGEMDFRVRVKLDGDVLRIRVVSGDLFVEGCMVAALADAHGNVPRLVGKLTSDLVEAMRR